MSNAEHARSFVFLQGPTNLLFAEVARQLRGLGHRVIRVNFCIGDELFWRGPGAVRFTGRPEDWPAFIGALFEQHRVTDLLLLGEQRPLHRQAIALAHRRGIEVAVTDFGYLRPDWVILERDGLNGDSRFERDPARIVELARGLPPIRREVIHAHSALNQALWDMAFHLSSAFFNWRYPHFQRHTLRHPIVNYLGTGLRLLRRPFEARRADRILSQLDPGAPLYLFAMQMEDDYSLRAYSQYPDLDTAMAEVVASFARHAPADARLVFKLHPLDPGLKAWRRRLARMAREGAVQERVLTIDGGDLDTLIRRCAGLLSVNSTAGLRALELERPTLALGKAIYRVPGLCFEGPLDAFWFHAAPPQPALLDAWLKLLGASLHVRGGMYEAAAIAAAADGMAYRLHHRWVNRPLAAVLRAEAMRAATAMRPGEG